MDEKTLISQIEIAEKELELSRRTLVIAKKELTNAETRVIENKIHVERLKESLRAFRARTPKYESSIRDEDIKKFRNDFPELVEWAKQRDLNKENK